MPDPSRQTLSFLIRRFQEVGIRPQNRYGQNFLIDMNLQGILLETAQLGPQDVVLEIGTGTGGLTALMAQRAATVVTVELDRNLFSLAGEELFDLQNVVMLQADALARKSQLNPTVLEAVAAQLAVDPARRFKLVANLPYNVATPILSNLLALERPPETITCTIQKELADRITARPGTKDYGALAIWVQCQCRAEVVRVLGPTVFWPRPKVSSAFLQIVLEPARRAAIPDRDFFHTFIRTLFLHRRKLLRFALHNAYKTQFDKDRVDNLMRQLGLGATTRAEELDPQQMLRLCETVRAELGFDGASGEATDEHG
jgi:16S rRNA (adenine1518-N6/adenine1519-N6)-dimethyltransferase